MRLCAVVITCADNTWADGLYIHLVEAPAAMADPMFGARLRGRYVTVWSVFPDRLLNMVGTYAGHLLAEGFVTKILVKVDA